MDDFNGTGQELTLADEDGEELDVVDELPQFAPNMLDAELMEQV